MKCNINENKEITDFWEDEYAPEGTVDCDKAGRPCKEGDPSVPEKLIHFWKLENGKVLPTAAWEAWNTQKWTRDRLKEYPSIEELTIALYDTDDKAALETKRAAVKTKWPKDNSGPVE